ncbi:hypothetical protein ACHAXR_001605 [Thalassiosira sp. AJA248-18]
MGHGMNNQLHATATASSLAAALPSLPSDEFNKEDLPKPGAIMSDPSDAVGHMVANNGAESASSAVSSSADDHNLARGTKSSAQATTKTKTDTNSLTNNDCTQRLESFLSKNFAEKLHALLSVPAYQAILRWNPSGESFGIYDTDKFASAIMATYFQRAKFDSFTRRMRRWGFRRMESMDEKLKGLVVFRSKLFLRDKPEMCKMMGDDRQWKKKQRARGSGSPHEVQRLMSATDTPSAGLAKRNGIKDHTEPVPVHFPTSHPEDFHWGPSINTMALPAYPSSSPPHQLASTQHLHQPMTMNHFVKQAFPTGSYPPQDTRSIPATAARSS